jgi:hypothetical protein
VRPAAPPAQTHARTHLAVPAARHLAAAPPRCCLRPCCVLADPWTGLRRYCYLCHVHYENYYAHTAEKKHLQVAAEQRRKQEADARGSDPASA